MFPALTVTFPAFMVVLPALMVVFPAFMVMFPALMVVTNIEGTRKQKPAFSILEDCKRREEGLVSWM